MTGLEIIIAILGGFFAGCINVLAGSGSAITLTILIEVLGLPANIANGSNRLGVIAQSGTSSIIFYKHKLLNWKRSRLFVISGIIGAIFGTLTAVYISNEDFMKVFRYLLILIFLVILIKPSRWLEPNKADAAPAWLLILAFLAIGFYGGFIQMGMGIIFLAGMVLLAKYDLLESNAVKVLVTAIFTVFVIAIFQWKGLIDWKIGGTMAIGQVAGGYVMANFASRHPEAKVWAYRALILAVLIALVKVFELHRLVGF